MTFAELVQDLSCEDALYADAPSDGCKARVCEVKVTMRCPDEFSKAKGSVTFEEMEACFKETYLAELYAIIKKDCKKRAEQSADVQIVKLRQRSATGLARENRVIWTMMTTTMARMRQTQRRRPTEEKRR